MTANNATTPSRLARIPQSSLRDHVVKAIRDAIVQGKFRPGEKVPEHDLARELGVSRTPIREAIRILEQQGLVETRPKNGTYIAAIDRGDVQAGLEVRSALEELAVREAIEQLPDDAWTELCQRLHSVLTEMKKAAMRGDPVAATELDLEWHTYLIEAAGNRYLVRAWSVAGLSFLVWAPERALYPLPPEEWGPQFGERHRELLDALETRDPDLAAAAIRKHILLKLDDLDEHGAPSTKKGWSAT